MGYLSIRMVLVGTNGRTRIHLKAIKPQPHGKYSSTVDPFIKIVHSFCSCYGSAVASEFQGSLNSDEL